MNITNKLYASFDIYIPLWLRLNMNTSLASTKAFPIYIPLWLRLNKYLLHNFHQVVHIYIPLWLRLNSECYRVGSK